MEHVSILTEQQGVVLNFVLFPAMRMQNGLLVRCSALAIVERDSPLPGSMMFGEDFLDSTDPSSGLSHGIEVAVRPRAGLTWGDVADDEDVVLDVERQP